ncbi:ACHE, partial [Symbiodinium sp. KB8]
MWSLACLLVAGAVSISATAAQTVEVPGLGHVAGYEEHGLHIFKGMPYAEPPVGPRRFAPPVPVESWGTSLDAPLNGTEFGASCFNAVQGGAAVVKGGQDERPRPVLVWLHGGGFLVGSSSQPIAAPPPETLTRAADTVFVSFNYRLGVNGFLAHRGQGLDHVVGGKDAPEQGQYGAGTAGLLDQRAAIHWTLKHIAAFGGDPRRVTLAGSSAGAISLCFHLTDPSIAPFINTAVMKSAFCSFPFPPLAKAFELGDALAQQAGCSRSQQVGEVLAKAGMSHAQLDEATVAAAKLYQEELQCLQSVDADALRRLIPTRRGLMWWEGAYWFPVVNGIDA